VADRFLVGLIQLPINGCMFTTPNFTVLNYTNNISKFSEDGVTVSINADALPTNVSVKCDRIILVHGA
jgi:hypothetical protein